eukprot:Lithocolla_globosa_v1_NODE_4035_length_1523_cov_17.581063.p1 type:complete len:345 gc:universal NODE_4035_length_1523_cov_17.581063:371-1405(+)
MVLTCALFFMWGGFLLYSGVIFFGLLALLFAALYAFIMYSYRNRIPFAVVMLETVTNITLQLPAMIFAAFCFIVLQLGWAALWTLVLVYACDYYVDGTQFAVLLYLVFSFYWTSQVIKNVLHVTLSGVFAVHYFLDGTEDFPKHPVAASCCRACTYSLGPVCFGSLLVAVIRVMRVLARSLYDRFPFLACCLDCILSCVEGLIKYLNHWAYTQVAIYGKSYCEAGKATMDLFGRAGLDAIIQDNFIDSVLNISVILVTGVCLGGGYLAAYLIQDEVDSSFTWLCAIAAALIGAYMMMCVVEVLNSGTAATFVCLAEDPAAMRRTHPEILNQMQATYQWVIPTNV